MDPILFASTLKTLTEEQREATGYKWVTEGEFRWESETEKIIVPKGFLSDGSTGGPDAFNAWLFHDWIYSTHRIGDEECTRQEADNMMVRILKWERAPIYAFFVSLIFKANPFWLCSKAWDSSGDRGPQYYDDVFNIDLS